MRSTETETCRGTTADGESCQVPAEWLGEEGYCAAHRPGGSEEMRRRGKKGGKATQKLYKGDQLKPSELPELETPRDAEEWINKIARALLSGRISNRRADTLRKLLKEFRNAHHEGQWSERMEELEDALAAAKRTGDLDPVFEVIDGGA